MSDQILAADALILLDSPNGLGDEVSDSQLLDLGTAITVGYAVGEHYFLKLTGLHAFTGGSAHDAVAGDGAYAACSALDHQVGRFGDGSSGV